MKRPALGLLILLGVLVLNQTEGGLPMFSGPSPADALWLSLLGREWAVSLACAALTSAVLLAIGRRRHRT